VYPKGQRQLQPPPIVEAHAHAAGVVQGQTAGIGCRGKQRVWRGGRGRLMRRSFSAEGPHIPATLSSLCVV